MTNKRLFGTDGIRGEVGQWPLTLGFLLQLGQAIGQVMRVDTAQPSVVIGRDTRRSGPQLEGALTAGLLSMGIDVHRLGVIPTPAVAYLTRRWAMAGGIVISASHNPYQDNGIKLFGPDGFKLPDAMEEHIEALAQEPLLGRTAEGDGQSHDRPGGQALYGEFLREAWQLERSLDGVRLVLDCADGVASALAPELFRSLGADCIARHCQPTGVNINTSYEYITPHTLSRTVLAEGADLGLAFDGDGDRVIFVDETGGFVNGDGVLAILAREMQAGGTLAQDTVVATVMSNLGLEISLAQAGIRLERTSVGDRYVTERMREARRTLGGEQAGHIVIMDQGHTCGDGVYTALRLLHALMDHDATLSELASCMATLPQVLLSVPVSEQPPWENLPEVQARIAVARSLLGEQGRVLVRYSGTEPVARVMLEGPEKSVIDELARGIADAIRDAVNRVG